MVVPDRQISPDDRQSTCNRCCVEVGEEEIYCDYCAVNIAEQELDIKACWWDNFDFNLYDKLIKLR